MKLFIVFIFFIAVNPVKAATCTASETAKMRNSAGVMEYCNGSTWMNMKGGDIGNCTAGQSGKISYVSGVYQYCNGTDIFFDERPRRWKLLWNCDRPNF